MYDTLFFFRERCELTNSSSTNRTTVGKRKKGIHAFVFRWAVEWIKRRRRTAVFRSFVTSIDPYQRRRTPRNLARLRSHGSRGFRCHLTCWRRRRATNEKTCNPSVEQARPFEREAGLRVLIHAKVSSTLDEMSIHESTRNVQCSMVRRFLVRELLTSCCDLGDRMWKRRYPFRSTEKHARRNKDKNCELVHV